MNSSPAVIIKSRFATSSEANNLDVSYQNLINYIDRDDAKANNNDYSNYQDYMDDKNKTTGLFTENKDRLTKEEKEKHKEIFKRAQKNGSIMWQDVISFNNEWLKENGVIKDEIVNEKVLQQATRSAVKEMLRKEGLTDSAFWAGAIHYNTDNIHIHLVTVQTRDFRERGMRKQSTLESMKSRVVNNIIDRTKQNEKLNDFIRNKVIKSKQEEKIMSIKNRISNPNMVRQYKKIYSMLPKDKRKWMYNMNALKEIKPEIDKLTNMYIDKNFKNEFKEFTNQLDEEVKHFKKIYGDTKKAERYKETKMNDLYTRMGNAILKEMKEYDRNKNKQKRKGHNMKYKSKRLDTFYAKREINNTMYHIDRYMKDELQSIKNQRAYEQLQREQEYSR